MLTRDDTWINKNEMIKKFEQIPESIPDAQLRSSVDNYFHLALRSRTKPKRLPTSKERHEAAAETIQKFPELIDYYIKLKEITGDDAADLSTQKVLLTEIFFSQSMRAILQPKLKETDFYQIAGGTYAEAHTRLAYLKHAIEDQGCWRIFYDKDGNPVERERYSNPFSFGVVWHPF